MTFHSLWPWLSKPSEGRYEPRMKSIASDVAKSRGVPLADIRGPSVVHRIAHARHHAMYEVRRLTGYSWPRIGIFFKRHHTTVMGGYRAHEQRQSVGLA